MTLEKRKLMMANSCNNRFCPMCAYRKARKEGLKHMILMKKLKLDIGDLICIEKDVKEDK